MKVLFICCVLVFAQAASAMTLNFGVFGGGDSRDEVDSGSIYGFNAELLWGGKDFKMGVGAHKALQTVNEVDGGYETFTINFRYRGFYLNPFYGRRAVKTSDLFDSDNLYPTQGAIFGYDFLVSKNISLGVMGIYENPGELDEDKVNADYVKLDSTVSPAITLKYWWW